MARRRDDSWFGAVLSVLEDFARSGRRFDDDEFEAALLEVLDRAELHPFQDPAWPWAYLASVLQDLEAHGLVQRVAGSERVWQARRSWSAVRADGPAGDDGGRDGGGGGGGDGGDNNQGAEGDGVGLRELLSHPYLFSYAPEDFERVLAEAVEVRNE